MKLTKRGRIVRNLIIAIIFIAIFSWLFDITTPKQCKVPVEQMSQFCKDLLYP
jgi:galactitol-specific phosphotransferase system IIC component